jgi:hypothetical protein
MWANAGKACPPIPEASSIMISKVGSGKTEKTVSWTAGTGDIGPVTFEFGGKRYQLELRRSDKLGC